MQAVTITQITPQELSNLIESSVNKVLENQKKSNQITETWFNLDQLCYYLPDKPKKPTVYGWLSEALIPYHKGAKNLRFLKSEIDEWLQSGKRKTKAEINNEVHTYVKQKGASNHE
jgi:hypothetical protein